jgi:hypothetical protein
MRFRLAVGFTVLLAVVGIALWVAFEKDWRIWTGSKKLKTPEDRSLTSAAFGQRGLPPLNRPWSSQDMAAAAKVLDEIAANDLLALPRCDSEQSKMVFARITSLQNLDYFRDKSVDGPTRFTQLRDFQQAAGKIEELYIGAINVDRWDFAQEVVEFSRNRFHQDVIILGLIDEVEKAGGQFNPGAVDDIKRKMASNVVACLRALKSKQVYSTTARTKLVQYMAETYPLIVSRLSSPRQTETLALLESIAKDSDVRDLQPLLNQLLSAVRDAVQKAESP